MNAIPEQKRADVRGTFTFEAKYRILTQEEYLEKKDAVEQIIYQDKKKLKIDMDGADDRVNAVIPSPWIVDFLFQLDEKMERILDLLSDKKSAEDKYYQGIGMDISGSGMKMNVDRPVVSGQIIHTNFVLSKFPFIRINLFGTVAWVEPVKRDDTETYNLGIAFLTPDEDVREKIISKVFQMQREAIRNSKKHS